MNNPPTRTLIWQLKCSIWTYSETSWQEGPEDRGWARGPGKLRPLFGFWGPEVVVWQPATSVGFWGLEVVARQAVTFVWVLGARGRSLASCDFCLGIKGWPGKLGHRGRGLASCDSLLGSGGLRSWTEVATSVWASGGIGSWPGKLQLLFGHQGTSGSSAGKLRPLFGLWGLDVVAWQAVTSVWVLGEQIEIWPGQSQLLSGQSRMLWPDGNRTTWPVVLPLSWLHRGKQSAKLFA
ncbi:hypothetical protein B0H14DRAFT_2626078 [Mycena olivaceomarginata]|nr:hypothetical protein B0H14DRAFT_2626078 [Mycena olivaceomarginata]